jgi:hypothetical protein
MARESLLLLRLLFFFQDLFDQVESLELSDLKFGY